MDAPLNVQPEMLSPAFATRRFDATVATWTAGVDSPKAVTDAVSGPGRRFIIIPKAIVSDVVDAAEIDSTVPLLSFTTLPAAEGSKLDPLMTSVVEAAEILAELGVTTGIEPPGSTTNPMEEVRGSPVVGSRGSTDNGAAVTANLLF